MVSQYRSRGGVGGVNGGMRKGGGGGLEEVKRESI